MFVFGFCECMCGFLLDFGEEFWCEGFFEIVEHFVEGDGVAWRTWLIEEVCYFLLVVLRERVSAEVLLV